MNFNLKAIGEHSYSWSEGFYLGNMPKYEGGMRQIDWGTVKQIIDSGEFTRVEVGLAEDYYQTHAVVLKNGELIFEENDGAGFYGASTWATPSVKLTKDGQTGLFECWVMGEMTGAPDWMSEAKYISYED